MILVFCCLSRNIETVCFMTLEMDCAETWCVQVSFPLFKNGRGLADDQKF